MKERRRRDAQARRRRGSSLEDLEQPHDRERFGGFPDLAAGGTHLGTRDAEELRVRFDSPKRFDQPGSERVPRRLPRDQPDFERRRHVDAGS